MAINNFIFNLDIEKDDYRPKFKVKQYDTAIFYVNLFKNNIQFSVSNETIKMFVKKSDGTIVYQEDNISIQDDTVKINVKNQALVCSGLTYAELEFKSSDGQVTSSTFLYEVKEKVGSDKAIESVTDIATLDKLKKYMEDAKKELERFKNELSKIEDIVANKDKLEGQNKEAKENIEELGKVLEDANNITSDEGKYITGNNVVSESTNGYIQDLKLYGRSLVNICNNDLVNSNKGLYYNTLNLSLLPLNTPLSLKIFTGNLDNKYLSWAIYGVKADSSVVPIYPYTYNFDKAIVTIPPGYSSYRLYLRNHDGNDYIDFDRNQIKINLIVGDENVGVYFEGLSSSGNGHEIEALSTNSNLFDGELRVAHLEGGTNIYREGTANTLSAIIKIPGGGTYYCKCEGGTRNIVGYFKDKPKPGETPSKVGVDTITVDSSGYLVFYITNQSNVVYPTNIMVNLGNVSKPYITHKQDKKTILFKDSDNKWNPITNLPGYWENGKFVWGDTVELHTDGKYYLHIRTKKVSINNSEGFTFSKPSGFTNTVQLWNYNHTAFPGIAKGTNPVLCDKLVFGKTTEDKELYFNGAVAFVIGIALSKGDTLDKLNTYLKSNPYTFVYQLANEEVYECLDISTRAFRNETMLSISSGAIDPGISYYVPTGFLSADNSLSEKVETLDKYTEKNMKDINNLNSNIEQNYFNINQGSVTDFNTALEEGKHTVGSTGDIPHAPYVDPGMGIYGVLEVLYKGNECIQRFTSNINKMFVRFRNYKGDWSDWNKATSDKDFTLNMDSVDTGFQMLPTGFTIQWGRKNVSLNNTWAGGGSIKFPIAFKSIKNVQAIICDSNFDDPIHGKVSVRRNTGGACSEVPFTVIHSRGVDKTGVYAFDWIAIGLV